MPATPALLAHTFVVHLEEQCTAAQGCSSTDPNVKVTFGCSGVLRLDHGDGWMNCADKLVTTSGRVLDDGRAEISFGPEDGSWRIVGTGSFDTWGVMIGSAAGGGYDSTSYFSAEPMP